MVTTVTSSVNSTALALTPGSSLGAVVSLVTIATFVFLLVTREMVSSSSRGWLARVSTGANIAIVPLGLVFVLILWSRFQQLFG